MTQHTIFLDKIKLSFQSSIFLDFFKSEFIKYYNTDKFNNVLIMEKLYIILLLGTSKCLNVLMTIYSNYMSLLQP